MRLHITHVFIASLLLTIHLTAQTPFGVGTAREFKDLLRETWSV